MHIVGAVSGYNDYTPLGRTWSQTFMRSLNISPVVLARPSLIGGYRIPTTRSPSNIGLLLHSPPLHQASCASFSQLVFLDIGTDGWCC